MYNFDLVCYLSTRLIVLIILWVVSSIVAKRNEVDNIHVDTRYYIIADLPVRATTWLTELAFHLAGFAWILEMAGYKRDLFYYSYHIYWMTGAIFAMMAVQYGLYAATVNDLHAKCMERAEKILEEIRQRRKNDHFNRHYNFIINPAKEDKKSN